MLFSLSSLRLVPGEGWGWTVDGGEICVVGLV